MSTAPSTTAGLHGWDELLFDPPTDLAPAARDLLPQLAEVEASWPGLACGDRIVHGDLRTDNMVRDHHRGVTFVDWAHATTGPVCIDAASLAPQLILAGHAPADIACLLRDHPAPPAATRPPQRSFESSPATGTPTPAGRHPRRPRTAHVPAPRSGKPASRSSATA